MSIKKAVVGSLVGLGLLGLTTKAIGQKLKVYFNGGYGPKVTSEQDVVSTYHTGSTSHVIKEYNLNRISLVGLGNLHLSKNFSVGLENKFEKRTGDVSYINPPEYTPVGEIGALGEASYSKNNLELAVSKEIQLKEKLSGLMSGGFGLRSEKEEEKPSVKVRDVWRQTSKITKGNNNEIIVKAQLKYQNLPLTLTLKTKYAHKLNGKQTFDYEVPDIAYHVTRDYDLSGSRLENEIALKKELNKKVLKGLELRLNVDIDNDKIKQTATTETTTPVYEDYEEKRIYTALQAVAYFKNELALKLGISQEDLSANGTLEVKTTKKPVWLIIGLEYKFSF